MSDVLRDNRDTFQPKQTARVGPSRLGLYATALGAAVAIAGAYLPWWSVLGLRWGSATPAALLALLVLLLAIGRYVLPRLGVLVQAQLLVGGVGLLVSAAPILQAVRLAQTPIIGAFVGVGPGALLSAAGFTVVVVVAWLER